MKLSDSFSVPAPQEEVWALLNDVPRVVPCMPGATLKEPVGDDRWRAAVAVKLGPMALTFDADVERTSAADGKIELQVKAREQRGRGSATATVASEVRAIAAGSEVAIETDLALAGAVAQYARGIAQEVAAQLTAEFAENLRGILEQGNARSAGEPAAAEPPVAEPAPASQISGFRLMLKALARWLRRPFMRPRKRTP